MVFYIVKKKFSLPFALKFSSKNQGVLLKKKRSSLPFALKFRNFRPRIRMFSKKKNKKVFISISSQISRFLCSLKKNIHFHLLSNFPIFVRESGCSLKKKVLSLLCHYKQMQNNLCQNNLNISSK